jgi:hypothetical protein
MCIFWKTRWKSEKPETRWEHQEQHTSTTICTPSTEGMPAISWTSARAVYKDYNNRKNIDNSRVNSSSRANIRNTTGSTVTSAGTLAAAGMNS